MVVLSLGTPEFCRRDLDLSEDDVQEQPHPAICFPINSALTELSQFTQGGISGTTEPSKSVPVLTIFSPCGPKYHRNTVAIGANIL